MTEAELLKLLPRPWTRGPSLKYPEHVEIRDASGYPVLVYGRGDAKAEALAKFLMREASEPTPIEPYILAAALDLLHRAAVELAQPTPPDPYIATASADQLRVHVRNLERQIEDRATSAIRVDQELGQLRAENRTLRERLAAKGDK